MDFSTACAVEVADIVKRFLNFFFLVLQDNMSFY